MNFENVPKEIRQLKRWLLWKFVQKTGEKKPRKMPFYRNGNIRRAHGTEEDLAQLVSFEEICNFDRTKFSGIGLALQDGDGFSALDFDNCVSENGINSEVLALTEGLYTEFSPSGKGLRAFVKKDLGNHKIKFDDFQLETFSSTGFVTLTGNETVESALCGGRVLEPSSTLLSKIKFCEKHEFINGPERLELSTAEITAFLDSYPCPSDYNSWLKACMAIHHETEGSPEGLQLCSDWSATEASFPGLEALEQKWGSFQRGEKVFTFRSLIKAVGPGTALYEKLFEASIDDFENLNEENSALPPGGHFGIKPLASFMREVKPLEWLIKGVLPKGQVGVLFGESGAGKTFVTFDLCAKMSTGEPWNGHKTKKSRILYVVAEGVNGFNLRAQAYCKAFSIAPEALSVDVISNVVPNLLSSVSANKLVADLMRFGPYDLLIFDTFAQVTPGANENTAEDMGKALQAAKTLGRAAGDAMVLLVHHSGKDSTKGARGHSSLRAACDFEAEVTRVDQARALSITKLKDGNDGAEYNFYLENIDLEADEEGETVKSCVVKYGKSVKVRSEKPLGGVEKVVMDQIKELTLFEAEVDQELLISACVSQLPQDDSKRDQRKNRVFRALESLILARKVVLKEGKISAV